MGSYAKLRIRYVQFDSWRDEVPDPIMILFTEDERVVTRLFHESSPDENEDLPEFKVEYVSSIRTLKTRLDFLGFTLETTKKVFDLAKQHEMEFNLERLRALEERRQVHLEDEISVDIENDNPYERFLLTRNLLLDRSTANTWLASLREAFLAPPGTELPSLSELANSFRPVGNLPHPRFPGYVDERFRLRFELEALDEGEVIFDVTELVHGEEIQIDAPLSDWSREQVHARDREALRVIVLTEGSTDKYVLEHAFRILRPELRQFVSFMDFAAFGVEGGASFLTKLVKSFAAAGIRDRIVALFDNDSAGCAAQHSLLDFELPENIRILRYPDIPLARDYPTLGPTGSARADVNGLAASIELYLGTDVLQEPDGSLMPIQWTGFDPKMKRFQGELVGKRSCMKRFEQKVACCQASAPGTEESWEDLTAIVNTICRAFEAQDTEFLIDCVNVYKGEIEL